MRLLIALSVFGLLAGLALFEVTARLCLGHPAASLDPTFRILYVDLAGPFFRVDRERNLVTNRYDWQHPVNFPLVRSPREKLVVIVGESVANLADTRYLQRYFETVFPHARWYLVNAGVNRGDAYRIHAVARQALAFKPDLIIAMMGNNPPLVPETVPSILYRHRVLRSSWSARLMGRMFSAEQVDAAPMPGLETHQESFAKDFGRLCAMTTEAGVPLLAVTLPQNRRCPAQQLDMDKDTFACWWFLSRDPRRILAARTLSTGRLSREYVFARAHEMLGHEHAARELYAARPLSDRAINPLIERIAAAFPRAGVVPFAARMDALSPGYDLFSDQVHYWPPVYWLMADEIFLALHRHGERFGFPAQDVRWDAFLSARPSVAAVRREIVRHVSLNIDTYIGFSNEWWLTKRYGASMVSCMRALWRMDMPAVSRALRAAGSRTEAIAPRSSMRPLCLGEMFREERRYEDARRCFAQVAAVSPGEPLLFLFRGLLYFDQGDIVSAAADFAALAERDRDFSWLTTGFLQGLDRTFGG